MNFERGEVRDVAPIALSALLGAFGVLSGAALFVLLRHEGDHLPYTFLTALFVAGVVAFLVETLRELVKHGALEREALSPRRLLVTILTLMTFEMFVMAWHLLPAVMPHVGEQVPAAVLGPKLAESAGAGGHFIALFVLWVVVGAALAVWLAIGLGDTTADQRRATGAGLCFGALGGAVIAPLAVLVYLLLARAVAVLWQMVADHDAWRSVIGALARIPFPPLAVAAKLVLWIDERLPVPFVWPFATLAVGGVLLVKNRWLFAVLLVLFVLPYLGDWSKLLATLGLVALVFAVPGAVLGGLTPALKRFSDSPALWAMVAFIVAVLLAALCVFQVASPWFLLVAGLMVGSGFLVRRSTAAGDWWPLHALAVGLLVFGLSSAVEATFRGVFVRFHDLHALAGSPLGGAPVVRTGDPLLPYWQSRPSLLDPAADYRARAEAARHLPAVERLAALDGILAALDEKIAFGRWLAAPGGLTAKDVAAGKKTEESDVFAGLRRFEAEELESARRELAGEREQVAGDLARQSAHDQEIAASERDWERQRQDRQFELCLNASLGYWIAIGLMAAHQLRRRRGHPAPVATEAQVGAA